MKNFFSLLFAICLCCYSIAENTYTTNGGPVYYSQATLVCKNVEENNVQNLMDKLHSYDMTSRVVDSLPFMNVEYLTLGRKQMRNLYRLTPFVLEPIRVDASAYGKMFELSYASDDVLHIVCTDEGDDFSINVSYGQPFEGRYFDGRILPTEFLTNQGKIYFRFRDHESLVNELMSNLQTSVVTEGSTVIAVGITGEVPQRDCEYLDKLCEIFIQQNLNICIMDSARTLSIYKK